jgi:hypothetical protein
MPDITAQLQQQAATAGGGYASQQQAGADIAAQLSAAARASDPRASDPRMQQQQNMPAAVPSAPSPANAFPGAAVAAAPASGPASMPGMPTPEQMQQLQQFQQFQAMQAAQAGQPAPPPLQPAQIMQMFNPGMAQQQQNAPSPAPQPSWEERPNVTLKDDGYASKLKVADMLTCRKMFIGGLNWETTDESLRKYFEQFGAVAECNVMRDGTTGRSRGFGFLTFVDANNVDAVVEKEHFLDGKIVRNSAMLNYD